MRANITNKLAERFSGDKDAKVHQVLWDSGDGAVKGFGLQSPLPSRSQNASDSERCTSGAPDQSCQ